MGHTRASEQRAPPNSPLTHARDTGDHLLYKIQSRSEPPPQSVCALLIGAIAIGSASTRPASPCATSREDHRGEEPVHALRRLTTGYTVHTWRDPTSIPSQVTYRAEGAAEVRPPPADGEDKTNAYLHPESRPPFAQASASPSRFSKCSKGRFSTAARDDAADAKPAGHVIDKAEREALRRRHASADRPDRERNYKERRARAVESRGQVYDMTQRDVVRWKDVHALHFTRILELTNRGTDDGWGPTRTASAVFITPSRLLQFWAELRPRRSRPRIASG